MRETWRVGVRGHRSSCQGHSRSGGAGQEIGLGATQGGIEATRRKQPAHSFDTLMAEMATLVRNTCRTPNADADAPDFEGLTTTTAHRQRALALTPAIQLKAEIQTRMPSHVVYGSGRFGRKAEELQISKKIWEKGGASPAAACSRSGGSTATATGWSSLAPVRPARRQQRVLSPKNKPSPRGGLDHPGGLESSP